MRIWQFMRSVSHYEMFLELDLKHFWPSHVVTVAIKRPTSSCRTLLDRLEGVHNWFNLTPNCAIGSRCCCQRFCNCCSAICATSLWPKFSMSFVLIMLQFCVVATSCWIDHVVAMLSNNVRASKVLHFRPLATYCYIIKLIKPCQDVLNWKS